MTGDGIAGPTLDLVEGALELVVGERLDLAAVVADEVVMVLAAGVGGLVTSGSSAEVDALDETLLGQQVEHAVDARDPDAAAFRAQAVEDLLCSQAAVLAAEQLDD